MPEPESERRRRRSVGSLAGDLSDLSLPGRSHVGEVPERMLKAKVLSSDWSPVGQTAGGHAAHMFTPTAVKSGFSTSGEIGFGPRDEKAAIAGADLPYTVPWNTILAVGAASFFFVLFFSLVVASDQTASPAAAPRDDAGRKWASSKSASPWVGELSRSMAAPPAIFTCSPFSARSSPGRTPPSSPSPARVPFRQYLASSPQPETAAVSPIGLLALCVIGSNRSPPKVRCD